MEPGTLELQIFVSLIVILGTAFVALVCDYLKGNNESLREHNIELRVRHEEQEKHQPLEAVQWLQQLLGANQRNPIRFGGARHAPRREAPAAARHATPAAAPAAADSARPAAPAQPAPTFVKQTAPVVQPVAEPAARTIEVTPPVVMPAAVGSVAEVAVEPRESRMQTARARRQASGIANPPSLLDTLPKPAWLQKEQEEKAAVRAMREEQLSKKAAVPAPVPTEAVVPANRSSEPAARIEPKRSDPFWTYRGLLDRVVAATSGPERVEEPSTVTIADPPARQVQSEAIPLPPVETVVEKVQIVESLSSNATNPSETITTVAIDVPAQPAAEVHSAISSDTHVNEFMDDEPALIPETMAPVFQSFETPAAAAPEPILAREPIEVEAVEPRPAPQVVSMPSVPELHLPPGYHDRSVFARHMHSHDVLTGVVAAIGINDYAHHSDKMGIGPMADLMRSVESMVAGMLRAGIDFGCRSNDDEFILVFPNETGADAQRRLTTISERLWNFQLRSLTSFSVFFSWGAVEVQGETLADAAASASERMYQTKRNRKTLSVDGQRRKLAVNL